MASTMLKGFKDFIMRGNVVDLAVGVVIGTAFAALVKAFGDAFLQPLIKALAGGGGVTAGGFTINKQFFNVPLFINAIITFLITAAVIYFLVVFPLNRLAERRKRGEEPPPESPSEEVKLLTEIRDALVRSQVSPGAVNDILGRNQPPRA